VKKYGFITYEGQKYKTVEIGKQTWMAENLNYAAEGSVCYDNKTANCKKYGRLYNWTTAMEVCPSDWHLPSKDEWQMLIDFIGGDEVAEKKLKAKDGWNGTDDYGFSAFPGGARLSNGNFNAIGSEGVWWSATEYNASYAYRWNIDSYNSVDRGSRDKSILYSVRCIKDQVSSQTTASAAQPSDKPASVANFTDPRNNKTYKTIKIGSKTWMAENLNYNVDNSVCYENDESKCNECGRLYDWETAMKACPKNWHLPTDAEWNAVGGSSSFSVLYCGRQYTDGFKHHGKLAQFWAATESSDSHALGVGFDVRNTGMDTGNLNKASYLRSVRCVEN
jgi:uncharacterized protein (TIGR02145 family)